MIKFFRRIRRKLIDEGNLKRYLIYAIGEILLVMIGILLALQVNNLNEKKKDRMQEIELLSELQNDLNTTESLFKKNLELSKSVIQSKMVIIRIIEDQIPWNDTLKPHFSNFFWSPKYEFIKTSYESLQNWGLNKLSNDSLRQDIIYHFQANQATLDILEESQMQIHWGPYQDGLPKIFDFSDLSNVKPHDFTEMKKDKQHSNREKVYLGTLKVVTERREKILNQIIQLKLKVSKELERLTN